MQVKKDVVAWKRDCCPDLVDSVLVVLVVLLELLLLLGLQGDKGLGFVDHEGAGGDLLDQLLLSLLALHFHIYQQRSGQVRSGR